MWGRVRCRASGRARQRAGIDHLPRLRCETRVRDGDDRGRARAEDRARGAPSAASTPGARAQARAPSPNSRAPGPNPSAACPLPGLRPPSGAIAAPVRGDRRHRSGAAYRGPPTGRPRPDRRRCAGAADLPLPTCDATGHRAATPRRAAAAATAGRERPSSVLALAPGDACPARRRCGGAGHRGRSPRQ
jgi:hypothetical protein